MGGIVVRVNFDERPVTDTDVRALCAAAPRRSPEGTSVWTSGAAGLGHVASAACRAIDERQPFVLPAGDRAVTFDGRIDNREELGRLLGVRGGSDAALAVAAFEAWGTRAPERLIGDFAFAIWDGRARRLFCARDALGIRPLYYWSDGRRFVCASDLAQILSVPGLRIEPNPGMIAEHIANAITSQDETVYAGIRRLPHGHSLAVDADGRLSLSRYWTLERGRALSCASDAEYAARFDDVFSEAVRCRLPQDACAAIYLSGGVDSSAVTAVAAAVAPPECRPEAFTLVLGDSPELDETPYAEDVCRHSGVRLHVTRARDGNDDDCPSPRDVFDVLSDRAALSWKEEIRGRGFRVAITGQGGDHGLFGSVYHYADLLRRGHVLRMVRQWRAARRVPGSGVTAKDLITSGAWPLVPSPARRLLRPFARRIADMPVVPPWVPAPFARSVDLQERLRPPRDAWTGGSAASWDVRRNYESGWMYVGLEAAAREGVSLDLEERHPFFDRRVVEFAAALPDEQRWQGELTRAVVRRALGDRLAPSVRTRTSSGEGSGRVAARVTGMAAAGVYDRMALAGAGWVDARVVAGMLRRMRERLAAGDGRYAAEACPLWIIGGTERWFRALFKSSYTGAERRASA